ncbi:MAG: resolvase [Armatimonadetes bacterium]|nr:resolvase [Armatimonadota bacterium]
MALIIEDRTVLHHEVIPTASLGEYLDTIRRSHSIHQVVLGDGTRSQQLAEELSRPERGLEVLLVDETNTTLEARQRFFQDHPPHGWRRWIPRSLLTPDRAYDDYAAILLAERHFAASAAIAEADSPPPSG